MIDDRLFQPIMLNSFLNRMKILNKFPIRVKYNEINGTFTSFIRYNVLKKCYFNSYMFYVVCIDSFDFIKMFYSYVDMIIFLREAYAYNNNRYIEKILNIQIKADCTSCFG